MDRLRVRLAEVRRLRADAEEMRARAAKETREVLREVQQVDGVTFVEAAGLLGLTKDGGYKALRGGKK